MQAAFNSLSFNIARIRNIDPICNLLNQNGFDISEVLRLQLVMAVSAFDFFIHEIVEQGIIEIYVGQRTPPKGFSKFKISISNIPTIMTTPMNVDWLRAEISNVIAHQSYQQADKVADAIKLISDIPIWIEVSKILYDRPAAIKLKLDSIVDRRNKIVHEADIRDSLTNNLWQITDSMITSSLNFIESVGNSIYALIK